MGWIILILYIIGAVTAYPRNKKWVIKNILDNDPNKWTNQYMIQAIVWCVFLWELIWFSVIAGKIEDIDWFYKKAKF